MKLLLVFLFATFVIGGTSDRGRALSRPLVLLGACAFVGMLYYSPRVL